MKTVKKEKTMKMFSLLIPIEDFKILDIIKKNERFTTTQQAVRFLIYSHNSLNDFDTKD